ncbi:hypothetical protein MNBD_GAMMA21-2721 [hydrothermal vent metagenome]|uniref:4-hydroxybenzoyl-CoA thioesterase family active site n=1 Tax=hydrothermal vent metagenome TaxID=652676 RepID=A0A3B1A097_9ZZZZ
MRFFDYRFTVSFEETNVVGNVYFANYFVWQGKCREQYLCEYAPGVLEDFKAGYGLITKGSSCEYHNESFAFQKILIQMSLEKLTRTGMSMLFDYYREEEDGQRVLLAQGQQSAIWVNPEHKVSMLPKYLYDGINDYGFFDET